MSKKLKFITVWVIFILFSSRILAQTDTLTLAYARPISTAVPFLNITPDARAGALGDMGVATSPDIYSIYWNSAKYAFLDKKYAVGLSYTPWLRSIVNDINLSQLVGFYRLNDRQSFAMSLRYFTVGSITLTNELGEELAQVKPNDFAIDAAYAMKLSDNFSGAVALRFIYSNLTQGFSQGGIDFKPGIAFAGDLGFYYTKSLPKYDINAGIFLSNLGSKISYSSALTPSFIPSNLRFGSVIGYHLNDYNKLSFGIDLNKLLVPTPPIRNSDGEIIAGKDITNMSVISGMFNALFYAPLGFKEKIAEYTVSTGLEYVYNNMFFARFGYFYENPYKGNRQYMTAGLGLKYSAFDFDFSYIIPINKLSPLSGTVRISLAITLGKTSSSSK